MNQNNTQRNHVSLKLVTIGILLIFLFLQASSNPNSSRNDTFLAQTTPTPPPMVTIQGTVTDKSGQPLHTYISVSSGKFEPLGNVMSDKAGKYTIQVPSRIAYIVNAQEADGRVHFGQDVIPSGYLDKNQLIMATGNDLILDIVLQPAGAIWLQTYDLSGNYLYRQDVNNNYWIVGIYPLGDLPTSHPLQYINHQENTFWGWRNGSDKNHPVLLIPSEEPVELWIHYHVPEIGDTYIHLDNDGNGYIAKKGEVLQVNFLFDAARTEYRLNKERIDQYISKGYVFTDDISQWNSEANQVLENMAQECKSGNFAACISASYTVLTRTLRSREDAVFQVAEQDIEKYKKGDVTLQIKNCDGTPMSGLAVNYSQNTHDFIFGVGWPENNQLPILKQTGFNGAIQEAWWGEVTSDGNNYNYQDERFTPITQQGMKIIMHTGVWISPITNPDWYFFPRMIEKFTPGEIADLARKFSDKFTNHYRDRISIYNAFNEPQNAFYTLHLTMDDVVNIAAASVEGSNQGAPDVPTYINFYYAYLGDMTWYVNQYNETYPAPEEILKAIIQKEIPFDNIGLEFYNNPSIDFGIYDDTIEHYSHFGKSVFISELSYNGNWHDGNTDQTPADWANYAYTIAFSKPYVTGVVWIPGNGPEYPGYLFQSNGNPRPIIDTIGKLTRSWTTTGNGITNEQGELTWRGFFGNYEIQWNSADGSKEIVPVQISQNANNYFILQPSSCTLAPKSITTKVATITSTVNTKGEKNQFSIIGMGIVAGIILLFIIFFIRRKVSTN